MKKILILFCFVSFWNTAYNQVIRGTIFDKNTKAPIDFASIYFNGTFVGTNTDKKGDFELYISKYKSMPLTISALGYFSVTIDVPPGSNQGLTVYLTPKVFELDELVISAKGKPGERKRNLELFRKTFLGESPNSMRCKILNEEDISFRYDAQTDTLKAFASKPLLIDNKALGYKVTVFMDKFELCKETNTMFLEGNIIFHEDSSLSEQQQKILNKARKRTYIGSRKHFIRSLWENKLGADGFTVWDSKGKADYNKYVSQPENTDDFNTAKYLNYPENLSIHFDGEVAGSYFYFIKDHAVFQKNGYCDNGIVWAGKMAEKRLADDLPFEYSIDPAESARESMLQNQALVKSAVKKDIAAPEAKPDQEQINKAVKEYNRLNSSLPREKIYVHTDRPNYMQGDTIWFKAYSWFGFDQIADTVSKVLYVDLINPEGKAELKRKLLIQNGTSVGEFSLEKNIPAGKYSIRAYTRWMQNENAGEPFYQTVTINAVNQNFQVDCSPLIIKQADGDSLRVLFRFYEMDPAGDLKSDYSHRVNYSLKIGDRLLTTGEALSANTKEQVFKCRLPGIGENDSVAVLNLSIKDDRLTFEKQFRIPLREEIDLQFFPEGGKLVNGLESKVAFKAIGTDGLSREVKGVIKDSNGEVVTIFESLHKGMGAFLFTPEAKMKYTAFLEYHNREFKFQLPTSVEEGCVMSVINTGNKMDPHITVKYTQSKANAVKYIVGSAYGKVRITAQIKTAKDSCQLNIPRELFPEGVSRLTLLDSDFKPECERLIYVDRNQRLKIEVKADSTSYGLRSKVSLSVKSVATDGKAVPANLSLSVVDKEQMIKEGGNDGINAYKLLESELKGNIEDPGWYFKNDSLNNHKALDLLLLTQGYRRFVNGNAKSSIIKYYPERGFEITGKVAVHGKGKGKNFNYSDLGLSLVCPSENTWFDQTRPDSLGKFFFNLPVQYGKPLSIIKAFTSTGKLSREKIPKEKSFRGDIVLDEAAATPLFKPQLASTINIAAPATEYVRQLQSVLKTEVSKTAKAIAWHLNLPEVTVTGKDKDWYTHFEDEAKKIADLDSLDPTGKKYGTVYDLLVRDFGAHWFRSRGFETIFLPVFHYKISEYLPIYVINGVTYCNGGEGGQEVRGLLNQLNAIKVSEIKRLMVLPPGGNITFHYADSKILHAYPPMMQSLVDIETYSRKTFYRGDPDGIKTFMLEGLDTPRIFYSPRYEGEALKNPIYDGRATIYWNPAVRTNDKGEAKVEFYTGDRIAEMEVIVNGIEIGSGFTGQKETMINSNHEVVKLE